MKNKYLLGTVFVSSFAWNVHADVDAVQQAQASQDAAQQVDQSAGKSSYISIQDLLEACRHEKSAPQAGEIEAVLECGASGKKYVRTGEYEIVLPNRDTMTGTAMVKDWTGKAQPAVFSVNASSQRAYCPTYSQIAYTIRTAAKTITSCEQLASVLGKMNTVEEYCAKELSSQLTSCVDRVRQFEMGAQQQQSQSKYDGLCEVEPTGLYRTCNVPDLSVKYPSSPCQDDKACSQVDQSASKALDLEPVELGDCSQVGQGIDQCIDIDPVQQVDQDVGQVDQCDKVSQADVGQCDSPVQADVGQCDSPVQADVGQCDTPLQVDQVDQDLGKVDQDLGKGKFEEPKVLGPWEDIKLVVSKRKHRFTDHKMVVIASEPHEGSYLHRAGFKKGTAFYEVNGDRTKCVKEFKKQIEKGVKKGSLKKVDYLTPSGERKDADIIYFDPAN